MKKFKSRYTITIVVAILLIPSFSICAQDKNIKSDTVLIKDLLSDFKNDSLLYDLSSMLDSMNKLESFFSVNASISNRLFSNKNNAFNSQQTNTGLTAFSPSISYFNKSGLGFSVTPYLRNIDGKFSLYQTALSPSYDVISKKSIFGISYSYYQKKESASATPYNHEVYAYIQGRKSWLRPSLAAGWAKGNYQDVSVIPVKINGNNRMIIDTSTVKLIDISLIAEVSHTFTLNHVLSRGDAITFLPQLSVIGGSQSFVTTSKMTYPELKNRAIRDDRIRKIYKISSTSSSSNFALQTMALSVNISYLQNILSISAGYFMGYYLNDTIGNELSHIFSVGMGLTF